MTVLEDGAGGDRHLVSAPAATPAVSPNRPSLSPCAPRAHPSGGPAQGYKILGTGLVAVEALLQLQQSPGIILAHDHEHYMLGLVASSKYPYSTLMPLYANGAQLVRLNLEEIGKGNRVGCELSPSENLPPRSSWRSIPYALRSISRPSGRRFFSWVGMFITVELPMTGTRLMTFSIRLQVP